MANNNALELTKKRIDSNEMLQTFRENAKAVSIPLFPETVQFTDSSLKYGAALVSVDTNLDKYGSNKDIYKNESGSFCLHLSKINEIAQQAGVQITDSRILERKTDEQGRVVFISHQIKGELKSVDGSIKRDVATGKYDYYRDKEKYRKRDGSEITGMINSRRSHAEALAESNAKTRLFNKLVANLPSSFSLEELKKPFLIPYVLEDKEELLSQLPEDERNKIKSELARKRLGLADAMYGAPNEAATKPAELPKHEEPTEPEDANYTVENEENGISAEEQNAITAKEWKEQPQKQLTDFILSLISQKNYEDPNGAAFTAQRIEKNSVEGQVKFIEKLLNLPDAEGDDLV